MSYEENNDEIMSNDMAYCVLNKRKIELENELKAIKIALSCFVIEQPKRTEKNNASITDKEKMV